MPELTEEQARAAFAGLRAETLPLIQPPGPAAAARTVRRRRRAGVATVALGVVAAVVAGVFVQTIGRTSQPPLSPAPSLSSTPSPTGPRLSDRELEALAARAATALGVDDVDNRRRRAEGKGSIISWHPGVVRRAGEQGIGGSALSENEAGVYVIEVVCLGSGSIRVRYWAAGRITLGPSRPSLTSPPDSYELLVPCGAPTVAMARVRAPWPQLVYTSAEADAQAVGRAAYALLLRMPGSDGR